MCAIYSSYIVLNIRVKYFVILHETIFNNEIFVNYDNFFFRRLLNFGQRPLKAANLVFLLQHL